MDHRFQIDLRGIIELLSNHLYSGPQVFLRELLQNAVDAIRARGQGGSVRIETARDDEGRPVLVVSDDGIGLTEAEIHRFLATIGESSKRSAEPGGKTDFIGQFGIGLLSCFVVSDEIAAVTRSVQGPETTEWRGRPDGTYSVRALGANAMDPGTRVTLRCKPGMEDWFAGDRVREIVTHFGALLPFPIHVIADGRDTHVNEAGPPWRRGDDPAERRAALIEYGKKTFGVGFLDCIPLRSEAGDIEGVAYVLPFSPNLAARRTHRVYLKGMLLSEEAPGLLPDWAFFVKCVLNANDLRPTASRESFYEDDQLAAAREALGACLRRWLVDLARHEPDRLRLLIALHHLAIKALAVHDEEFFALFVPFLPFETSMGTMTLAEYRQHDRTVRFVRDLDEFRQIAAVARAQGICVLNAAYAYDLDLVERAPAVLDVEVEPISAQALSRELEEVSIAERDHVWDFLKTAERVLAPFGCGVDVRKFRPDTLPALYSSGSEGAFRRAVERTKEVSGGFWSSVMDGIASRHAGAEQTRPQLTFNYRNALVRKIARLEDARLQELSIQLLYVQSLLLGHHPLHARELGLLNDGLLGILEWGADLRGSGGLLQ